MTTHPRSPSLKRWLALAGVAGLIALAPAAVMAQSPAPAGSMAPAGSPAPVVVNPYFETGAVPDSGKGLKIGYISLGDSVPFVKLVSDSITEQAGIAGVDYLLCDSKIDQAAALDCANQMKVFGAQGVINFQVFQDSSPEICTAYGGVPTIAVDIIQPPCQVAFMGANNRAAGRMGGEAIGKYAKDNWNCDYTAYVSLESTAAGAANTDRMGGYRDGFQEFCPIDPAKEHVLDGADRTDPALQQVSDLLPALPGNKIVVVAINEDGILGAEGAARTLGRDKDLFYSGQGTDPSIWKDIACNPNYIASVAYFPERYGKSTIPAMIDILKGKAVTPDGAGGTVPANLFTAHQLVTADNIRTVYPATPAC